MGPQNRRPTWLCSSLPCLVGLALWRACQGLDAMQGHRKEKTGAQRERKDTQLGVRPRRTAEEL